MTTRGFDQSEDADSQNKTMWSKEIGRSKALRLAIPGVDQMRYTADETWSAANRSRRQTELRQIAGWSDCQLTADTLRLQMNHVRTKRILVQKKSSVIGGRRIFLTKMYTTDGKGICQNSWRK